MASDAAGTNQLNLLSQDQKYTAHQTINVAASSTFQNSRKDTFEDKAGIPRHPQSTKNMAGDYSISASGNSNFLIQQNRNSTKTS